MTRTTNSCLQNTRIGLYGILCDNEHDYRRWQRQNSELRKAREVYKSDDKSKKSRVVFKNEKKGFLFGKKKRPKKREGLGGGQFLYFIYFFNFLMLHQTCPSVTRGFSQI